MAFRDWAGLLPADIELVAVRYPGRLDRLAEPMPASVSELAASIVAALQSLGDVPIALFGHSMGAIVALEMTALLDRRGAPAPRILFVSGREAPRCARPAPLQTEDDATLLARCRELGTMGPDVLADPELCELVLPVLRADHRLIEAHRPDPGATVTAPIVAYVGDRDPGCSLAEAGAWSAVTTGAFDLRVFPGDHFYFTSCLAEVVGDLSGRVRAEIRA
jgi:pyochelin biosynthetic protein PchC